MKKPSKKLNQRSDHDVIIENHDANHLALLPRNLDVLYTL